MHNGEDNFKIECRSMECFGPATPLYGNPDDAADAWNRRSLPAQSVEVTEENFCEACAGTGFKLYSRRGMMVTFDMATDCPECDGTGTADTTPRPSGDGIRAAAIEDDASILDRLRRGTAFDLERVREALIEKLGEIEEANQRTGDQTMEIAALVGEAGGLAGMIYPLDMPSAIRALAQQAKPQQAKI
jgi:hypothetical protein